MAARSLYQSKFGIEYTDRSNYETVEERNNHTLNETGRTISQALGDLLGYAEDVKNILEVGAGVGHNLELLSKMGYKNLHGSDIQEYAVELGTIKYPNLKLICADSLSLPFEDNSFDVVLTRMHLIHFHPKIIDLALKELIRVSAKYIVAIEYFDTNTKEILWRGEKNVLWKQDFLKLFKAVNSETEVIHEEIVPIKYDKYKKNSLAYQHFIIQK